MSLAELARIEHRDRARDWALERRHQLLAWLRLSMLIGALFGCTDSGSVGSVATCESTADCQDGDADERVCSEETHRCVDCGAADECADGGERCIAARCQNQIDDEIDQGGERDER